MSQQLASGITTRLFIGCLLTSEIKMYLSGSSEWKTAQIEKTHLLECRFEDKDYLGLFLEGDTPDLSEIQAIETKIREKLEVFCPALSLDTVHLILFPQVFIS